MILKQLRVTCNNFIYGKEDSFKTDHQTERAIEKKEERRKGGLEVKSMVGLSHMAVCKLPRSFQPVSLLTSAPSVPVQ